MLKETWPDHANRSSVAITKLPLGRDIRKKMNNKKKEKRDFFENNNSLDCLTFWLVIVHTASLLAQEHSKSILWRNFV